MSIGIPAPAEQCDVEFTETGPGSVCVVSFSDGANPWKMSAISRAPNHVLAILLRYGWAYDGKRRLSGSNHHSWHMNRAPRVDRAVDDALYALQQP